MPIKTECMLCNSPFMIGSDLFQWLEENKRPILCIQCRQELEIVREFTKEEVKQPEFEPEMRPYS